MVTTTILLQVNLKGTHAGRLKKEQIHMIVESSKMLVKPRDILMAIKNRDPSNYTTIKTIYNAQRKYRVMEQAGRSQMPHLMQQLQEHNYVEWHRACEVMGDVKELF